MRGRVVYRIIFVYRLQVNGLVESMNKYFVRVLRAVLEGYDLVLWEGGLLDFVISCRGFRYVFTGKSSYKLVMGRLM